MVRNLSFAVTASHRTHILPFARPQCCRHMTQSYLACPKREITGCFPVPAHQLGNLVPPGLPLTPAEARCCDHVALGLSPPTYNACSTHNWSSWSASNQRLLRKPAFCSLRLARQGDVRRESQCLPRLRSRPPPHHSSAPPRAPPGTPARRTCIQTLTFRILLQSRGS